MLKKGVFLFPLLLTACVSGGPTYIEPSLNTDQGASSSIVCFHRTPDHVFICHLAEAKLRMIDETKVKYSMNSYGYDDVIKLTPGKHSLVVMNDYVTSCAQRGTNGGLTEFDAVLKPGVHYHLNGKLENAHVYSWLENEQGQRVSEVASAPAEFQQPASILTLMAGD